MASIRIMLSYPTQPAVWRPSRIHLETKGLLIIKLFHLWNVLADEVEVTRTYKDGFNNLGHASIGMVSKLYE